MADFPALPLFTDAYMADTEHLSDAEHGIYLRLLMIIWRNPNCRIPNDMAWIARRLRKNIDEVEASVLPLIEEFFQADMHWITQKRLHKEWKWCAEKRQKNTIAAKSRWEKEKT